MYASVPAQIDAGVASALGAVVGVAAVGKLARPGAFARNLQLLDRGLASRPALARRIAVCASLYEAVVAVGVVALRANPGFVAACATAVACVVFLFVLDRAVREVVPCACFGRAGRDAAAGREVGRAIAMLGLSAYLVVHRALDARGAYGLGPWAVVAFLGAFALLGAAQQVGGALRPAPAARPAATGD